MCVYFFSCLNNSLISTYLHMFLNLITCFFHLSSKFNKHASHYFSPRLDKTTFFKYLKILVHCPPIFRIHLMAKQGAPHFSELFGPVGPTIKFLQLRRGVALTFQRREEESLKKCCHTCRFSPTECIKAQYNVF